MSDEQKTPSPADRVRERLNELLVGPMRGGAFRDYSPDAIGVRLLGDGTVELADKEGHSFTGHVDRILAALADLEPSSGRSREHSGVSVTYWAPGRLAA